ncbi:MAG: SpoIIE family protein phosphatase [Crocinitomicaceae bacterium]
MVKSYKEKTTTIFRQLILNIILPVVVALITLALINFWEVSDIHQEHTEQSNRELRANIETVLASQDKQLQQIERDVDNQLEILSEYLVSTVFKVTDSIEIADLDSIRVKLGMDTEKEDIYIIDSKGVIVNTTYEKDRNKNVYEFGDDFKDFIISTREDFEFTPESFTIEQSTLKLRKYTYQATKDHKYVVQIGVYNDKANQVLTNTRDLLNNFYENKSGLYGVDLFFGEDNPFSLNRKEEFFEDKELIIDLFGEGDSKVVEKSIDGKFMRFDYVPITRENSELYRHAVIRIISDNSAYIHARRWSLIKNAVVFVITILVVILLIFRKTKVITNPIKKLVNHVSKVTDGNFYERATVEGNNEITKLSKQFNLMVERLEDYYKTLERKVEERTAEIEKQKEAIVAQKKDIEDSIRYAKRIQTAILPPSSYVRELFEDHFIYYVPKDIVSGDFYWASDNENFNYIAAVDCTGHGVPGAFMSIVGNDQLHYALNVKKSKHPSEILDALNEGVTQTLRQEQNESSVRDGMDISLIGIDKKKQKLEYAGANNNMYLIRNGELIEYQANRNAIGGFYGDDLNQFSNHSIDIQKGDTIYIFSDGFPDQFGGPKGKKFKYKNFKNLLLSIQGMSMEDQKKEISSVLKNWIGNLEQLDDILVIGIRI